MVSNGSMMRQILFVCMACATVFASPYGGSPISAPYAPAAPAPAVVVVAPAPAAYAPAHGPSYAPAHGPSYAPAAAPAGPQIGILGDNAEAQAAAITNVAGAKASAAKLNHIDWNALNAYGHQIGVPLLVKNYGALTNLYAASLPARSFVGQVDAGFEKGAYGKVQFNSGSSIAVAAI